MQTGATEPGVNSGCCCIVLKLMIPSNSTTRSFVQGRTSGLRPLVLLFLLCSLLSPTVAGSRYAPQRTRRESAFDQIWRTVRDRFHDPKMNGRNWREIGDRYRPLALAADSRSAFQEVVNRMLDELKASHIGYYTDDDLEYYLLPSAFGGGMESGDPMTHIGVTGHRENGVFVVGAILNDSPAEKAGVRVGDRLMNAGGHPFSTVGAFRGSAGNQVALVIERNGARQVVSVRPVREHPQGAFLTATKRSARIIEYAGLRIGYIHLWTMTDEAFRQALTDALTGKLASTDGLVLDLRDGFGGRPFHFTDVLFRPEITWENNERGNRSTHRDGYARPVVALINRGTRSAKEYLSYELKKSGRALLVGTNTAGAFLGATGSRIGEDGYLEVPVTGLKVDGIELEGRGVAPDVAVEPQDTYGPADSQFHRGLELLADRIRSTTKRETKLP